MSTAPSVRVSEVVARITSYLAAHPSACDTAQGVLQWWLKGVDASPGELTAALDQLVKLGRLERLQQSSRTVYRARAE